MNRVRREERVIYQSFPQACDEEDEDDEDDEENEDDEEDEEESER